MLHSEGMTTLILLMYKMRLIIEVYLKITTIFFVFRTFISLIVIITGYLKKV